MRTGNFFVTAILGLANLQLSAATPVQHENTNANALLVSQVAQNAHDIDLSVIAAGGLIEGDGVCAGQSCDVADVSGSSGRLPKARPEGAKEGDIKCIVHYNPVIGELLKENKLPNVTKQDTGISSSLMGWLDGIWRPNAATLDTGSYTGTCAKNILIFAKGTLEPTEYGITVGPSLIKGWDSSWTTAPVVYNPDVPGDYCLGLPGGMVVKDMINQAAQKCPQSKIFVSGYSQGAMVARNGLAYASDAAKSHVKGIITFGDPFQGAPIKGYNGPIKVYCKINDGVCTGNFELAGAHLSYPFDDTVTLAKAVLKEWAAAP